MNKLLLLLLCAFSTQWAMAQDAPQTEKSLVKTFEVKEANGVSFDCKQKEIKAEVWNGGTMRVELIIKTNMPDNVTEQLVKANRYELIGSINGDGEYVVTAPNVSKAVTVKGVDLQEDIIIKAQTPAKYIVSNNSKIEKESFVMRNGKVDMKKKKMTQKVEMSVKFESTLRSKPENVKLERGDILIGGEPIGIE